MLNRIVKLLLIVYLFNSSIFTQENGDPDSPSLMWKPIPKIKNYQLQVRDSAKKVIVDKKLKETSYTLELEPGNYEHRVGVYNKFNKLSAFTLSTAYQQAPGSPACPECLAP